jgi:hypothetical protein
MNLVKHLLQNFHRLVLFIFLNYQVYCCLHLQPWLQLFRIKVYESQCCCNSLPNFPQGNFSKWLLQLYRTLNNPSCYRPCGRHLAHKHSNSLKNLEPYFMHQIGFHKISSGHFNYKYVRIHLIKLFMIVGLLFLLKMS